MQLVANCKCGYREQLDFWQMHLRTQAKRAELRNHVAFAELALGKGIATSL